MTLARLLASALVVCSLPAFAQDLQSQSSWPSTGVITVHPRKGPTLNREASFFFLNLQTAATPSEPWMIFSDRPADLGSAQNALDPLRLDQYKLDQVKGDPRVRHLKLDALDADTTCYMIRSYVVARDSKDSDSTHPAGYSTCQPPNRYQVKSADLRVVSGDR